MRRKAKLTLLGVGAAVAALALGGAAMAREAAEVHEARLLLPDGSAERIRYLGDVARRLAVMPAALAAPFAGEEDAFGFAALDRLAAQMHAQAAAMLHQADLLAVTGGAAPAATAAGRPVGTVSYSMVSFSSDGGGTCRSSVRVTSLSDGQAPQVVRQSSGDCQPGGHGVAPAVQPAVPSRTPVVPVAVERAAKPRVRTTPI